MGGTNPFRNMAALLLGQCGVAVQHEGSVSVPSSATTRWATKSGNKRDVAREAVELATRTGHYRRLAVVG